VTGVPEGARLAVIKSRMLFIASAKRDRTLLPPTERRWAPATTEQ
jgi:hypothetical protein